MSLATTAPFWNPATGKIPKNRLVHLSGDLPFPSAELVIDVLSTGLSRQHAYILMDGWIAYYQGTSTIDIDLTAIGGPSSGAIQSLGLGAWNNTPPSIAGVHSAGHIYSRLGDETGDARGDLNELRGFLLPPEWILRLKAGTSGAGGGGTNARLFWSFLFARFEWE